MPGYVSDRKLEREKRRADLRRIDELTLHILGISQPKAKSLPDLVAQLAKIRMVIDKSCRSGMSISDMIDLVETHERIKNLLLEIPDLILNDEVGTAGDAIWQHVLGLEKSLSELPM